MSVLNVNRIADASGGVFAPVSSVFRSRIINGGMVIDQRNAGASVTATTSALYSVDRWSLQATQNSKFTGQQNAGSITPPVGFTKYLGCTSSSAYSLAAGDVFGIQQAIEGFNFADLGWGTANAKTVTLSFQVYSSLTGTFGGCIYGGQSYPFSYSIPTANTWTTISVTIAGSTSGSWPTDNNAGAYLFLSLGVGSTYSGTAGAWSNSTFRSATGATSVVGTNGATFYITGVQLEVGTQATSFEYRQYTTELQLCQRYFWRTYSNANNPVQPIGRGEGQTGIVSIGTSIFFPNLMRAAPTLTKVGTFQTINCGQPIVNFASVNGFEMYATTTTAGNSVFYSDGSAYVTADAEL